MQLELYLSVSTVSLAIACVLTIVTIVIYNVVHINFCNMKYIKLNITLLRQLYAADTYNNT